MRTAALFEMLFGLVAIIGGCLGFDAPLPAVATIVAGLVLIASGLAIQKKSRRALMIGLVLSLLLAGWHGYVWLGRGHGLLPAGLEAIFAALSLLVIVLVLVQPQERKRIF
ncbi:MAG TPA: hypothetical protein VHI13_09950 [Candidatus Kapabacteria bacterium]|nr:hypothetical protein [Candidatus Kapabacteria bacterium]